MSRQRLLLLVPLVLTGACATPTAPHDTTEREWVADPALEQDLALVDPRVVGEDSTRALEVDLENRGSESRSLRVRVAWFGAAGTPVTLAPRIERQVTVPPGGRVHLKFEPMPSAARSWRLSYAAG